MKQYMGCGSSILSYKKLTALIVFVGAIAVLIVAIPAFVSAAPGGSMQTATVTLRTLNNSGISGHLTIRDDGSGLSIRGTAQGLDPAIVYISLLYDISSVATGGFACEPALGIGAATAELPGRLTIDEMGLVGFAVPDLVWDVSPNGHAQLSGTVDVDLDRVRTISIRSLDIIGEFGPGTGPLAVMACGVVVPHGG